MWLRATAGPRVEEALVRWTASGTAGLLWLLGADGRSDGALVLSALAPLGIVADCTGIDPILVFVAALAAFPGPWKGKLAAGACGVTALVGINLLRLASLCYVSHWLPGWFDWAHLVLWQGLLIFSTVTLWILSLRWLHGRRSPRFS